MLSIFVLFLCIEGLMLIASMLYVSPLISRGSRRVDAPPVMAPLPKAVAIPTAYRRNNWRNQ